MREPHVPSTHDIPKTSTASESSTNESPRTGAVSTVLAQNIATLNARRDAQARDAPLGDRIAAAVTTFSGSMTFVYIHLAVFGFWVVANLGLVPLVPPWDGNFIILGTSASIEAIFLSTFILITQNRMAAVDSERADLDVQISLLSEHELTRLISLVTEIAAKLGVEPPVDPRELEEITSDIAPEQVLDVIEDPPAHGTSRKSTR